MNLDTNCKIREGLQEDEPEYANNTHLYEVIGVFGLTGRSS
ncbi:hypothetical protein [Paenibacillus sp. PCH8]|nr:hypothetical protein [Paenibacillus sp. PCH8]